ncbi:tyrosine-type recombinase/integrase [Streptomyces sp. NPDC087300]|uniref:tyrosine-type recombinase/integrase n=1 Tax=Streptomyces sp. NPDC087300 TaxID=3365780 RepID=UPI003828515A
MADRWPAHRWPEGQRFPDKPGTAYQYAVTLVRVAELLDPAETRDVAEITGAQYAQALTALWGTSADRTWNRNRATVASFLAWCADDEQPYTEAELPRRCRMRKVPQDNTRAVEKEADLDPLWDPDRFHLRERSLWRAGYESAARGGILLRLDVPDLELDRFRARVQTKGGNIEYLLFGTKGTELITEYVGGRTWGPVWLTKIRPRNWRERNEADRGPCDLCRLSYDRAEKDFKAATRALGMTGEASFGFEWLTLHQSRHSRLTHLAEDGWDTPELMTVSHHKSAKTLLRYARPSAAAVGRKMREQAPRAAVPSPRAQSSAHAGD